MAQWPEFRDEAQKDREQVEWAFGLTGGEMAHKSFAGYLYNYDGVPEYAESDFPDWATHEYQTVIVTGGGYLPIPAPTLEHEGQVYELVNHYMSSGETDCPVCGAGTDDEYPWADQFEDHYGRPPRPDDECGLCETRYTDMPGLIYVGDGYEAVYRLVRYDEEQDEDPYV